MFSEVFRRGGAEHKAVVEWCSAVQLSGMVDTELQVVYRGISGIDYLYCKVSLSFFPDRQLIILSSAVKVGADYEKPDLEDEERGLVGSRQLVEELNQLPEPLDMVKSISV